MLPVSINISRISNGIVNAAVQKNRSKKIVKVNESFARLGITALTYAQTAAITTSFKPGTDLSPLQIYAI